MNNNDKIDWKAKLGSRKFWAMLIGQITAIATAFNASESMVLQISAILGGFGILAIYILAESHVDAKREESSTIHVTAETEIESE